VSWYRERLNTSLELILRAAVPLNAEIIDIVVERQRWSTTFVD
jgi:hypothetical protein